MPLQIGDTLPDLTLTSLDGKQHRLSDYQGKALVLNLMSIYCGTCLANMPHITELSEEMKDSLHIFFVVPEDKETTLQHLSRLPRVKPLLPRMIQDTVLNGYFPHRIVPHVVWLNRNRQVTAITEDREVTAENLRLLYSGTPLNLYHKADEERFRAEMPLPDGSRTTGATVLYRSTITSMVPGGECLEALLHDSDGVQRLLSVNMPIDGMYRQTTQGMWLNHVLMEITDTTRYKTDGTRAWDTAHSYTYELTVPEGLPADRMYQYMREDLDRFFGVTSRMGEQLVSAWVIQRKEDSSLPPPSRTAQPDMYLLPDDTIRIKHFTLAQLADAMNGVADTGGPIFADGTGWDAPVDLELDAPGITDLAALQRAFEKCGLRLVKKEVPLKVLVVRDKPEENAIGTLLN